MKQVIVMRKDLKMRKGKMIAQGAHASMKVLLDYYSDARVKEWLNNLFTKICVSVNSEDELLLVYGKAKLKDIPCSLIEDAGLTEFNGVPTLTCCCIGPDENEVIDLITGELNLL